MRERLFGPRVTDEAFAAEVERTPGVSLTAGWGKQNIRSRRINVATLVVAVPGVALLLSRHPLIGGLWVFGGIFLIVTPVSMSEYRRIRVGASLRPGSSPDASRLANIATAQRRARRELELLLVFGVIGLVAWLLVSTMASASTARTAYPMIVAAWFLLTFGVEFYLRRRDQTAHGS